MILFGRAGQKNNINPMRKIIGNYIEKIGGSKQTALAIEGFFKKLLTIVFTPIELFAWHTVICINKTLAIKYNILSKALALFSKGQINQRQLDFLVNHYFGIKTQSRLFMFFRSLYFGLLYKLKSTRK